MMRNVTQIPQKKSLVDSFVNEYSSSSVEEYSSLRLFQTRDLQELWKFTKAHHGCTNIAMPYWGIVWPAAIGLGRYLLEDRKNFAGKRILELATGSGYTALVAGKISKGAIGVDIDQDAIQVAQYHAFLNQVNVDFQTKDILSISADELDSFEIILAADVFYMQPFANDLMDWWKENSSKKHVMFVADCGRWAQPQKLNKLIDYTIQVDPYIDGIRARQCSIFKIENR